MQITNDLFTVDNNSKTLVIINASTFEETECEIEFNELEPTDIEGVLIGRLDFENLALVKVTKNPSSLKIIKIIKFERIFRLTEFIKDKIVKIERDQFTHYLFDFEKEIVLPLDKDLND